ncbi:hypothetical protein PRIPAC_92629 [Pristionchus pacificus]|uniref:Uncharacterized protein n=1 Tax=Pristionchus pacificus TaxID=54126 RepID=A0A2A6CI56_PRIPA|nr:hypothetical protein PRIPAC_92629 [Pristionchus pacificus]|eukprot:PDM77758.1 hypothetical protein PRIPAC_34625 [Pristionchus pacificus]
MIILLVLMPALLVLSEESGIDWKKCRPAENKCLCTEPGAAELIQFKYETKPCAEVGVQIIALSYKSAIFLLQVMKSDASDLGDNPELMIYNGLGVGIGANKRVENEMFGCKLENGKVVLTGDREHIRRFKINLFEDDFRGTLGDASYFKKENILCALETRRFSKLVKQLNSKHHETQMKLTTVDKTNPKVFKIERKWFEEENIKCDFYEFGEKTNNEAISFELSEDEEVKRLECKEEEPGKYSMILVKKLDSSGAPVTEIISKPDSYAFFCAANVGELCRDPMDCDKDSPECPQFHPGGRGEDAKLECPGNKWIINDEYYNLTTKCKVDELRNSNDFAVNPKPKPKAEAQFSEGTAGIITALVSLAVIAFIVALILLGYYIWKRRKNLGMKPFMVTTKTMKTMGRAELIADCKEDFGKFLQATPSSADFIIDGLKKIDGMLKEEVDDPYAWEEAYKFLMRFHGSIRLVDRPIWHMFTRYLYLESKRIIDKHGWLTSKPIRNSNQYGLIRSVAIHLLSFTMHDSAVEAETLNFIIAGFRVLGFKGATQYPHCGLLWSLVCHARPMTTTDKKRANDDKQVFDHVKFEHTLNLILKSAHWMNIPVAERIPAFGSIPYQAAFAIGGIPDIAYIADHAYDIVLKKKPFENRAVSMGYFEGLCQSVMRNPIESILTAFRMVNPNPKILAMMHDVAPAEVWNKLVKDGERVETYYGRHLDAKRLHERFMPNDKDTDFFKMQQEQNEFLAAVEHVKSDLRHWFAARTDKDEFKQKAAEFTNPNINMDRLFGDYVPPPLPNPKKVAGTGSQSGSNSIGAPGNAKSSDNGKPPSDPKDAAAAPAAAPASN